MAATVLRPIPERSDKRDKLRQRFTTGALILVCAISMLVAMRGAQGALPVEPDAARHALNGVLIHDMIRDGGFWNPVGYARDFYRKLPGVSMPFHPPVFPAFEAGMYSILGVNYPVARLAIAICVAGSVILLYLLAKELSNSSTFGLAATAIFHSLPLAQWLSSEVMLEYPALVITLAALLVLTRSVAARRSAADYVAFGIIASIAIWTKQNAIFLAAVPLILAAFILWRHKRGAFRVLAAYVIIVPSCLALWVLMQVAGATANRKWPPQPMNEIVLHNAQFYANVLARQFTIIGALAAGCAVIWLLWKQRAQTSDDVGSPVLAAWILSGSIVPLLLRPFDIRYIFGLLPALLIVVLLGIRSPAQRLAIRPGTMAALATLAVISSFIWRSPTRAEMGGFAEAAQHIASSAPKRVLICSTRNGSFTFALRTLQADHGTSVLRGDRLTSAEVKPAAFADLLHRYGVDYVVLHDAPQTAAFDAIPAAAPTELTLEKVIPVTGNIPDKGLISIYKHLHATTGPVEEYLHRSDIIANSQN